MSLFAAEKEKYYDKILREYEVRIRALEGEVAKLRKEEARRSVWYNEETSLYEMKNEDNHDYYVCAVTGTLHPRED